MPGALTLTAYARLRGVSVKSVSRAIAAGRLVQSVGRDHLGRPTIVDVDLAGREWNANTQRRAEPNGAPEPASSARAAVGPPPQGVAAASPRPSADDLPPGIPPLNTSRAIRAHALARRDTTHADIADVELAKLRGRLVDADAARADVEQAYSLVKTRLLRVPSDLAQRLPHLAAEVVPVLEELQRQALEELAR